MGCLSTLYSLYTSSIYGSLPGTVVHRLAWSELFIFVVVSFPVQKSGLGFVIRWNVAVSFPRTSAITLLSLVAECPAP